MFNMARSDTDEIMKNTCIKILCQCEIALVGLNKSDFLFHRVTQLASLSELRRHS